MLYVEVYPLAWPHLDILGLNADEQDEDENEEEAEDEVLDGEEVEEGSDDHDEE